MSVSARLRYYRRIVPAYLGRGRSQLTFWHETPAIHPQALKEQFGHYYMSFREKADYAGHYDAAGIPMLDYHGAIGLQYNPIAVAQWGLGNCNVFLDTHSDSRKQKMLQAADWLAANLEQNQHGIWVWKHHFDWEYRDTLRAPWYSGLAQGQGVSLLLRAYAESRDEKHRETASRAIIALKTPIMQGGVLFEDEVKNLWIEEYLVHPPTHILNGFIWALWGVFDYWVSCSDASARTVFDRGVETLLKNLSRYDTGYWSLYEQSGTRLRMLASPFYHRLHIIQMRVMAKLTGERQFEDYAERWEGYTNHRLKRARVLVEKGIFKLVHY